MSFAAKKTKTAKMPAAANPVEAKIEEWKREVKKLEAAPVAEGFVKSVTPDDMNAFGLHLFEAVGKKIQFTHRDIL